MGSCPRSGRGLASPGPARRGVLVHGVLPHQRAAMAHAGDSGHRPRVGDWAGVLELERRANCRGKQALRRKRVSCDERLWRQGRSLSMVCSIGMLHRCGKVRDSAITAKGIDATPGRTGQNGADDRVLAARYVWYPAVPRRTRCRNSIGVSALTFRRRDGWSLWHAESILAPGHSSIRGAHAALWWLASVLVFGVGAALLTWRDELLPEDAKQRWRVLNMIPHWSWGWWVVAVTLPSLLI